jgi:hypothetical protein
MAYDDSTTYCIYRIVNFKSGKVYVGKSKNPTLRKYTHFSELRNNHHTNPHLQNAFNQYGADSFYFEILEKGILKNEINQREIFWIDHFNSFKNGYNRSEGGETPPFKATPCTWNGIQYPTIRAAAKTNGVTETAMRRRLSRGYAHDNEVFRHEGGSKPCVWNNVSYRSINAAARANGYVEEVLRVYVSDRGYKGDSDIPIQAKSCMWNGIQYPSINAAARALRIDKSTMQARLRRGYKQDADVTEYNKKCFYKGIEYPTMKDAAKANGVTLQAVWYWVNRYGTNR